MTLTRPTAAGTAALLLLTALAPLRRGTGRHCSFDSTLGGRTGQRQTFHTTSDCLQQVLQFILAQTVGFQNQRIDIQSGFAFFRFVRSASFFLGLGLPGGSSLLLVII